MALHTLSAIVELYGATTLLLQKLVKIAICLVRTNTYSIVDAIFVSLYVTVDIYVEVAFSKYGYNEEQVI